ncbi:MAG: zinc ribbon domain-containing protein, partial [Ruminococcus flavefaciens]|nr:zinc ribbon domain-containing protein [Ruminococcus flavefaciens]
MNCKFCNAEIEDNSKLCTSCGRSLTGIDNDMNNVNVSQINDIDKMQQHKVNSCKVCGATLLDGQAFCTRCGTPMVEPKIMCSNCGAELQSGQMFCSVCGKMVDKRQNSNNYKPKGKKKFLFAGAAAVIIIAIVIVALVAGKGTSGNSFAKMYSEIASESWCEIGTDGKWMELDTNPDDIDKDDMTTVYYLTVGKPCNEKIEEVNAD